MNRGTAKRSAIVTMRNRNNVASKLVFVEGNRARCIVVILGRFRNDR